jgi:TolB-like protein/Flp pilus assembly protein TadD/predicted Ser/Thr protein kinase
MIGTAIGQYRIVQKLGEGGMGVVYKAEDTSLDRVVALKFLPEKVMVTEEEQARFAQEAKAAATLNHPNVCTIHDIKELEGHRFIVMEYVEGETLRERASGSGIGMKETVDYAIQIAEALQEAHTQGIVHRDIKSENIMINTRGQVKVMDFGLAKLRGSMRLTKSSSTIGTLGYMAPEQIQAEQVDARSDIFSFGVVLYEMLTGRMPFRGEHDAAMMYSILTEHPEPLPTYLPDAPSEIVHVLNRALEKDPGDRYQSAGDMAIDLRRCKKDTGRVSRVGVSNSSVATAGEIPVRPAGAMAPRTRNLLLGAALLVIVAVGAWVVFLGPSTTDPSTETPGRKMLAVLPFQNLGDPEMDYFADGITEEITSRLAGLSGLGVIGRSSALQYKNTSKPVREIGEELGVTYVLEGTVRWEKLPEGETRVRVNPQLIKVEDATQVWGQPYEAVLSGVFEIQSEIASKVARALDVTLLASERKELEDVQKRNPEAYDLFLRANTYADRGYAKEDWEIAQDLYTRAAKLDPTFNQAYARISRLHSDMYWFHHDRTENRLKMARQAAQRAIELNPTHPDGYEALGWYYYHGLLDYSSALEQFDQALRLRPQNAQVIYGIGAVKRRQGKFEESLENFENACDMDPRDPTLLFNTGETHLLMRNYDESVRYFERSIILSPDWGGAHGYKAEAALCKDGDVAAARAIIVGTPAASLKRFAFSLAYLDMYERKFAEALESLDRASHTTSESQFYYKPSNLVRGMIYSTMGNSRLARVYYDSARIFLESELADHPDDPRMLVSLGIVHAGLGHNEEAIRSGQRAVELLPMSKEAYRGAYLVEDLARIYTMTGDHERALERLELLLSVPSQLSPALLRINPVWDPLREYQRFKVLAAGDHRGIE